MELYSLKFNPILTPRIWGGNEICKFKNLDLGESGIGESWEISDVRGSESVVANGELCGKHLSELIEEFKTDLVGKHIYERFGNKFPLLVKFIDASNDLSIQVHPDDKLAMERHNSFGKTEMWYVVKAKEGAGLYSGFSTEITPDEYVERVEKNTFMDVLKRYEVEAGDVFFLPAGRVHAIGSGLFVAEIQQTSDVTYRIYDYNRRDKEGNSRELHTELAKEAIDYSVKEDYKTYYKEEKDVPVELADCKYFHTNLLELEKPVERDYSDLDSFVIFMNLKGECVITDNNGNKTELKRGETVLIPSVLNHVNIDLKSEDIKLLEIYIP